MNSRAKKSNRFLTLIILVIILSVLFVFYTRAKDSVQTNKLQPPKIDGVVFEKPLTISPFVLTGTNNKPFTNANLKGHWTIMFFGFTNCPFVCPTTLAFFK